MKILISKKTGYYYYIQNLEQDYHCKEGVIDKEELNSNKNTILSKNTNREFIKFEANRHDLIQKIKRGPQIITPKDLGYIISRTQTGKNDTIVEAGGGSGAATLFFANIAKHVNTFEIREEHTKIIQTNLEKLNCEKDVTLKTGNLADEIESIKNFDLLFLDMPNPNEILEKNIKGLKSGKFIVCYVPSIFQIQEITKLISLREDYYLEEISEVILRHWRVWEKISRPEHKKETDHTAFLVFIRKI